jgi:hypothetical protein
VVVCPFAFHIAVQQPFKPLWSRLFLYELEPSRASFALCFNSLLMTLLPASLVVSVFVWRLPFDLSSKGGPASSYATAGIALRVTDVRKPLHQGKVGPPTRRTLIIWAYKPYVGLCWNLCFSWSVYVVRGRSRCLFRDKYRTHKYSVGRM